MNAPQVTAFFDEATNTVSYVVRDPAGAACAVVDSVLDFDYASGRTDTHRITVYSDGSTEYFDLAADPWTQENLAPQTPAGLAADRRPVAAGGKVNADLFRFLACERASQEGLRLWATFLSTSRKKPIRQQKLLTLPNVSRLISKKRG